MRSSADRRAPGLGARFVEHFADAGWEAGCEAAAHAKRRVIVEDLALVPDRERDRGLQVLLDDGIRAFQSTPLLSRDGRCWACSTTTSPSPTADEHELRYLDLLARMAADFIERSQREQMLREADRRKDEFRRCSRTSCATRSRRSATRPGCCGWRRGSRVGALRLRDDRSPGAPDDPAGGRSARRERITRNKIELRQSPSISAPPSPGRGARAGRWRAWRTTCRSRCRRARSPCTPTAPG